MPDYSYETSIKNKGYKFICGVDEAGRGPLAGPVCAAAVILPQGLVINHLNDSKKLTEKRREQLYDIIKEVAIDYSIGFATVEEVEELNILNATMLAMRRAVLGLKQVDFCIIDGNKLPELPFKGMALVKGDSLSMSVAAASVLAKVTRDRLIIKLDQEYPLYNFKKHKGYGTAEHIENIKKYGPCKIHRRSFLKNIIGTKV